MRKYSTMVERPERQRVGEAERAVGEREWETFLRDETEGPMRHVGSLTAPSADVAYEQAVKLFGWYAEDVWVCPADEVARYSTHDLDDDAEEAPIVEKDEPRTHEP